MKKRDRRALARYVRHLADRMELRDWTIAVGEPLTDGASLASIDCTHARRFATMRLCSTFRDLSADEQRATVVHELIHCHFEPAWAMVRDDLQRHLGERADRIFFNSWRRQMEYGVEAMTQAIAPHLPLIDWPG